MAAVYWQFWSKCWMTSVRRRCARAMSRAAARTNSVRRWGSMASSITRGSNASSTMASYRNPAHVGT